MTQNVGAPNIVDVMEKKTWKSSPRDITFDLHGQQARLTLRAQFILAKADPVSPITFWVSLLGSEVSSGALSHDEKDHRGWYQDKIRVYMYITRKGKVEVKVPAGLKKFKTMEVDGYPVLSDFRLIDSGPETQNGTGSVSSSVSFSFSESFSGGFFGDMPTASVGGSASTSSTNSYSHTYSDFEPVNRSKDDQVFHDYEMRLTDEGAPYAGPKNLIPDANTQMSFGDHFEGVELFRPPSLATSNFPLISQAVWQASHNNMIGEDAELLIQVEQHVADVTGTNKFFTVKSHATSKTITYTHRENIPFKELKSSAGTTIL